MLKWEPWEPELVAYIQPDPTIYSYRLAARSIAARCYIRNI